MTERLIKNYLKKSVSAISLMENISADIKAAAGLITDAYKKDGKIILFGNGGSAADAQHIATELVSKYRRVRSPIPALALTTNTSLLTAIGNDYSFNEIFSRQLEACVSKNDVAIAISTSGNSENVLKAIDTAGSRNVPVIGMTSKRGGQMNGKCAVLIKSPSEITSRVQECHITAAHIMCEIVENELFG